MDERVKGYLDSQVDPPPALDLPKHVYITIDGIGTRPEPEPIVIGECEGCAVSTRLYDGFCTDCIDSSARALDDEEE